MRSKILAILFISWALGLGVQTAQAGTVRYAGKKISQGSTAVASATSNGVQAAGGGLAAGGKAPGGALQDGGVGIGKGVKATPGLAVRGVKGAGKGIAKVIW